MTILNNNEEKILHTYKFILEFPQLDKYSCTGNSVHSSERYPRSLVFAKDNRLPLYTLLTGILINGIRLFQRHDLLHPANRYRCREETDRISAKLFHEETRPVSSSDFDRAGRILLFRDRLTGALLRKYGKCRALSTERLPDIEELHRQWHPRIW